MIINTITDLRNLIDDGDYGTTAPWADVRDEVARRLSNMFDCPDYGTDWTGFLNQFNFSELVIQADDAITAHNKIVEIENSIPDIAPPPMAVPVIHVSADSCQGIDYSGWIQVGPCDCRTCKEVA